MILNNGSYYQWENDELVASIIYHDENDGGNPSADGLQIHTSDGGLWVVGYLPERGFDIRPATAIVNKALKENKDFNWWKANGDLWFALNVILA